MNEAPEKKVNLNRVRVNIATESTQMHTKKNRHSPINTRANQLVTSLSHFQDRDGHDFHALFQYMF